MDSITLLLSDIMQHVSTHLQPHEVAHFSEHIFQNNDHFETVVKQMKVDEYHHIMDKYNQWIQPKGGVSPWTLESRVRALEREQEKSRVIENSFVELLQEQRVYFENKLNKNHHV